MLHIVVSDIHWYKLYVVYLIYIMNIIIYFDCIIHNIDANIYLNVWMVDIF